MNGGKEAPEEEEEPEEPPAKEKKSTGPRAWVFRTAALKAVEIRLKVVGPLGARRLGAVTLRDEAVDLHKLAPARLLVLVNGLALRALANVGFDAVDGGVLTSPGRAS